MKTFILKSTTVFMSALVVIASVGFTVVEHECALGGKEVYVSFLQYQDYSCGSCSVHQSDKSNSGNYFKRPSCCKHSEKLLSIDAAKSFQKSLLKTIPIPTDTYSDGLLLTNTLLKFYLLSPKISFFSFSSRHYGRSMLAHIQSFVI